MSEANKQLLQRWFDEVWNDVPADRRALICSRRSFMQLCISRLENQQEPYQQPGASPPLSRF